MKRFDLNEINRGKYVDIFNLSQFNKFDVKAGGSILIVGAHKTPMIAEVKVNKLALNVFNSTSADYVIVIPNVPKGHHFTILAYRNKKLLFRIRHQCIKTEPAFNPGVYPYTHTGYTNSQGEQDTIENLVAEVSSKF